MKIRIALPLFLLCLGACNQTQADDDAWARVSIAVENAMCASTTADRRDALATLADEISALPEGDREDAVLSIAGEVKCPAAQI